jgi:hypothetical protein
MAAAIAALFWWQQLWLGYVGSGKCYCSIALDFFFILVAATVTRLC